VATRNFYARVSRRGQPYLHVIDRLLLVVGLGGFVVLVVLSQVSDSKLIVGLGGRIWWSCCCILAALDCCVHWVNPDRELVARNPKESMMIVVLNGLVLFAVVPWFWTE
jgi:hypothetical protein